MKIKRWPLMLCVALLAGGGGGAVWYLRKDGESRRYRTARIERGDIVQTVRATGVVQPIRQVQVGTQVNGPISRLSVDFNSPVKAGDLVAQIDPTVYEARAAQDQANLQQAEATVEQNRAKLARAAKELQRSHDLAKKDLVSQSDLDTAESERDVLAAQLRVSEAAVNQAQAALRVSRANLAYTTIRSPVDGVVIDRSVNEGQTVVASMAAQTMFTIATDLKQVQVEASIPEADIGGIRMGQPVRFNVDAYPEDFEGRVTQVRLAATKLQNVVTYPVIIEAANPALRLFPGMTASISCEVGRKEGVLKAPNAALRFRPESSQDRPEPPRSAQGASHHQVWVQSGKGLEAIPVEAGMSDGTATEVSGARLSEGLEVLVGVLDGGGSPKKAVNPFTPQRMPGQRR